MSDLESTIDRLISAHLPIEEASEFREALLVSRPFSALNSVYQIHIRARVAVLGKKGYARMMAERKRDTISAAIFLRDSDITNAEDMVKLVESENYETPQCRLPV